MTDVSWWGLAGSLALIAMAVAVSVWRRLGLERSLLWAAARAAAQLAVVGAALRLVIDPGQPLAYAFAWVAGMVVVATLTVRSRAKEVPGITWLALGAFAASTVVTMGLLFGLRIFELTGRTLVPLSGMVIGNSIASAVLVGRRTIDELKDKRDEVEARLALGQPSSVAARPYVRAALRTALVPQIESTKVVGLVSLPGTMTGLILAGTPAAQAVKVQLAVMYMILGSVAATTVVVALGLQRRLFTSDHRLRRLPATG
jgi:putative ABC transport system permease protein